MKRWVWIALAAVAGIGLGLLYGWVLNPVQFVDLAPETLRADYRADYVLMVAEAYQSEKDTDLAARRLAIFGGDAPADIAASALPYGQENGFSASEIAALEDLVAALRAWQPASGTTP
jgi:hypothetical protein